jgi:protein involved in polysaccharide export with SLBB domain
VTLRGNVANPGRFSWHDGMHLSDLIPDRDSLLSRDYWWKRSHLGLPAPEFEPAISTIGNGQRPPEFNSRGLTTSVTQETLTSALTPRAPQASDEEQESNTLPISGRTGSRGVLTTENTYPTSQNKVRQPHDLAAQPKVNDVRLADAGINWYYAVIERTDPDTLTSSLIPFDLGKLVINHDSTQDLSLQPGDSITIFSQDDIRIPINAQTKYVKLEGEFVHAGFYSVLPGETLRDLVHRAGGLTSNAYLYGSEFTRESTRVFQQQRLDEYIHTVSMEAERGTQALAVSGSSSSSSASDVAASQAVSQGLLARLSQVRATGRIVLQFRPTSSIVQDVPEIGLQNGDKFVVPSASSTVNVIGAVYDQNSFLYQPGRRADYYLKVAGGPNRNADRKHSFIIRADGSVVSSEAAKGAGFWRSGFSQLRLNPGDTIIVPDKTLRPTALRNIIDWSQVFSQLALGSAAINIL